jgi:hypothetical protein
LQEQKMRHLDRYGRAPRERPISFHSEAGDRRPSLIWRDGASLRMAAAMAGRLPHSGRLVFDDARATELLTPFSHEVLEDDERYYRRRSREECRAAAEAAGAEARAAHRRIASHYARMSRALRDRGGAVHPRPSERARLEDVLRRRFGPVTGGPVPRPATQAYPTLTMAGPGIPARSRPAPFEGRGVRDAPDRRSTRRYFPDRFPATGEAP